MAGGECALHAFISVAVIAQPMADIAPYWAACREKLRKVVLAQLTPPKKTPWDVPALPSAATVDAALDALGSQVWQVVSKLSAGPPSDVDGVIPDEEVYVALCSAWCSTRGSVDPEIKATNPNWSSLAAKQFSEWLTEHRPSRIGGGLGDSRTNDWCSQAWRRVTGALAQSQAKYRGNMAAAASAFQADVDELKDKFKREKRKREELEASHQALLTRVEALENAAKTKGTETPRKLTPATASNPPPTTAKTASALTSSPSRPSPKPIPKFVCPC